MNKYPPFIVRQYTDVRRNFREAGYYAELEKKIWFGKEGKIGVSSISTYSLDKNFLHAIVKIYG